MLISLRQGVEGWFVFFGFIFLFLLSGCQGGSGAHYAPVVEGWRQPVGKQGFHRVQRGETLYEIAWRYGLDYRALARANGMTAPYAIYTGQRLFLVPLEGASQGKKTRRGGSVKAGRASPALAGGVKKGAVLVRWQWPAEGVIIKNFSETHLADKGIDIAGKPGGPVFASAAGEVVYSGNGLINYGNLIIIKHDADYLSAYAHNKMNGVVEGDKVKRGQKIGEMGSTGAVRRVVLHFEIRQAGKPVDPLLYLPKRVQK